MHAHHRAGFNLVELLVVIAIIGLLIALLLPSVNAARESGRRAACGNNLHQLITALDVFENQFNHYPAGRDGCDGITTGPCNAAGNDHRVGTSAFVRLLPFLEQQPLFDTCIEVFPASVTMRPFYRVSAQLQSTRLGSLVCPSDTAPPGGLRLMVDGVERFDKVIPLLDDRRDHRVEVSLAASSRLTNIPGDKHER